jgi:membrane-associated phospholipid phosphatase
VGPTLASFADWERAVLHLVTCRWHAPWVTAPLDLLQQWEVGLVLLVLGAAIVALRDRRRAFRALVAGGVGAGVALAIGTGLWYAIGRARPGAPDVYPRILRTPAEWETCADDSRALALRSHGSKRPSFPSHHGLTAGAFAMALWLGWRPLGIAAWLVALVVGYGRLYFGKHWPSDVVAGLALGALLAWAAWRSAPAIFRLAGLRWLDPPLAPPARLPPPP